MSPRVLWFTGLPSSGKSTIAQALAGRFRNQGLTVNVLDSDQVRAQDDHHDFSKAGRLAQAKRLSELAATSPVDVVLVASISPYQEGRAQARTRFGTDFFEIHVDCQQLECERRDPKGHYRLARQGQLLHFTGVDDPYEPPLGAEVTVRTDWETIEESVLTIEQFILPFLKVC